MSQSSGEICVNPYHYERIANTIQRRRFNEWREDGSELTRHSDKPEELVFIVTDDDALSDTGTPTAKDKTFFSLFGDTFILYPRWLSFSTLKMINISMSTLLHDIRTETSFRYQFHPDQTTIGFGPGDESYNQRPPQRGIAAHMGPAHNDRLVYEAVQKYKQSIQSRDIYVAPNSEATNDYIEVPNSFGSSDSNVIILPLEEVCPPVQLQCV